MLSNQMTQIAVGMVNKEIIRAEDKEIVAHGLKAGVQLLFNILTTIIMGLVFGLAFESLIFLISFSLIRTYTGGYHCKKAINCYFFSSGIVIMVLTVAKFTPTRFIPVISLLMLLLSLLILLKLAPVETSTKPIDEVEKNVFRKKAIIHLIIECAVITILFALSLHSFYYIVCLGISVSGFLVFIGYKQNKSQNF